MVDPSGVHNQASGQFQGPVVQAGSIHNLWLSSGGRTVSRSDPAGLLEVASRRAWEVVLTPQDAPSGVAVEQITEEIEDLALDQPRLSPNQVLGRVVQAQQVVFSLLNGCRSPAVRRRLYFMAGIVSTMLARAGHEAGHLDAARLHARAALRCADYADHGGLRARVRALQSALAYWGGRPDQALRYAQSGTQFAERSGSTMAARLPVSEARAWALLGRTQDVRSAIARAERAWDRVVPDDLDGFGGVCTFTWSRHLHFTANALTWLPDEAGAAERYATAAVEAYRDRAAPGWAFGAHAGAHIDLALSRIRRREVEGAVEALAPVLDLSPQLRISTVVRAVGRVRTQLDNAPPSAASRDLQECIDLFVNTALDALPS